MRSSLSASLAAVSALAVATTAGAQVPREKQTTLGLYLTARAAYEMWKGDSARVRILDVRTTEEYLFVGHAAMAWNVPAFVQTYQWDSAGRRLPMKPNPDFIAQVRAMASPTDTILVMCRSGGRSAMAVNRLAEAGFTHVYNIVDGMEGDAVEDPESVFLGYRMRNGWKNSALPWTYAVARDRMVLPAVR